MFKSVIHIGANKTGSTTLQRHLFSSNDKIVYLGEDCSNYETYQRDLNALISSDDLFFDFQSVKSIFDDLRSSVKKDQTFVFSNEDIVTSNIPSVCAKRLFTLMPDAQILIVLRNQLTAIPSWYTNHGAFLRNVPHLYWKRYVPFDDWMEYCFNFLENSPLSGFFYHKHIQLYSDLFGQDRINILLYEDLINDRNKFIDQMASIFQLSSKVMSKALEQKYERKRFSASYLLFNKIRSRFLPELPLSAFPNVLREGKSDVTIPIDKWKNKICDLFKEGNTTIANGFNIDLQKYKYPLETSL